MWNRWVSSLLSLFGSRRDNQLSEMAVELVNVGSSVVIPLFEPSVDRVLEDYQLHLLDTFGPWSTS
jgi:hypothetical protein